MRRLSLLLLFAVTLGGTAVLDRPLSAEDGAGQPDSFLVQFGNKAIADLTDPSLSDEAQVARFRELLYEGFDVPLISQFVAGRYWRGADEQARREFVEVFEHYLDQRFRPLFREYQGQEFRTTGVRSDTGKPHLSWVAMTVDVGASTAAKLEWRVRKDPDGYKILDVKAEGVSMAQTLRDEYASVARRQGGLPGLTRVLREKIQQGAFTPDWAS
ncbi:MAG: ABC transporter substrate-binding protein [Rhodovibrionaceae bacterium]